MYLKRKTCDWEYCALKTHHDTLVSYLWVKVIFMTLGHKYKYIGLLWVGYVCTYNQTHLCSWKPSLLTCLYPLWRLLRWICVRDTQEGQIQSQAAGNRRRRRRWDEKDERRSQHFVCACTIMNECVPDVWSLCWDQGPLRDAVWQHFGSLKCFLEKLVK